MPCSARRLPWPALRRGLLVLASASALFPSGCRAAAESPPTAARSERAAIRETIEQLYAAFCFDPRSEPDWETQRRLYLEGACFVPPVRPDRAPVAQDTDAFLSEFRAFASAEVLRERGFHERIIGVRIERFGGIAHAFVAFEGYFPDDGRAESRGLDSLQLVRDGEAWRLVSFATQYERDDLPLPARFVGAR